MFINVPSQQPDGHL